MWTACSPTIFKLLLLSSCRSVSAVMKRGWNQRQIKTSFETGRTTQWRWNQMREKDDLFTLDEVLMLEVFVSGIYKSVCLRYFGTSLLRTDKKTLAGTWTRLGMCNRARLCFSYRFNVLYFPPFQRFGSVHPHAQRGCQFSIDYSTIRVMVILNNMTCIAYSWERWFTYSQFIGIIVWPPAGWRHFLKSK